MNTSSFGFRTALCFVFALAARLVAQTPGLVMLFKTRGAVQSSASSAESFESAHGVVEVYSGPHKISGNDDWGGSSQVSYAAQVSGVNNATGISLVEIYEVP